MGITEHESLKRKLEDLTVEHNTLREVYEHTVELCSRINMTMRLYKVALEKIKEIIIDPYYDDEDMINDICLVIDNVL